jgi:hypothetical protein
MDNGSVAEKAFALAIAGSGLVAFALTVALIQQARRACPPGLPARAPRLSVCCSPGRHEVLRGMLFQVLWHYEHF